MILSNKGKILTGPEIANALRESGHKLPLPTFSTDDPPAPTTHAPMTPHLPKLSQLKPEAKCVMIAEFCGWRCLCGHDWIAPGEPMDSNYSQELPKFTSSLDAMHEAEKLLICEQQWKYLEILGCTEGPFTWNCCHATATQRADAFILTIGKATL